MPWLSNKGRARILLAGSLSIIGAAIGWSAYAWWDKSWPVIHENWQYGAIPTLLLFGQAGVVASVIWLRSLSGDRSGNNDPSRPQTGDNLNRPQTSVILVLVADAAIVGLVVMFVLLHMADSTSLRMQAVRYGFGIMAGGGALALLLLSIRRQLLSEKVHLHAIQVRDDTATDALERRITDQFDRAVTMIESKVAVVRMAGMAALERIGRDNPEYRQVVVNILCGYLRMPHGLSDEELLPGHPVTDPEKRSEFEARYAAQEIIERHLRPDCDGFWPDIDLRLGGAMLYRLNLAGCHIRSGRFPGATYAISASFHKLECDGELEMLDGVVASADGGKDRKTGDVWPDGWDVVPDADDGRLKLKPS